MFSEAVFIQSLYSTMGSIVQCFIVCFVAIKFIACTACDDTFGIDKYSVATTNAHRDYYHSQHIFPHSTKVNSIHEVGKCTNGMKLQFENICFELHSLETSQREEGLLAVDILEKKISKKWKNVMDRNSKFQFDTFLDFSIAFFVDSLDEYITKWEAFNRQITGTQEELEYIGIEWYMPNDYDLAINDTVHSINSDELQWIPFYSLLIHSPSSAITYEFLSYVPPSDENYKKINWIQSDIQRATFKGAYSIQT